MNFLRKIKPGGGAYACDLWSDIMKLVVAEKPGKLTPKCDLRHLTGHWSEAYSVAVKPPPGGYG